MLMLRMLLCTAFISCGGGLAPAAEASVKKGLGMWSLGGHRAAEAGASWYYDWGPYPKDSGAAEFVPMIWGNRDDYPRAYQYVRDNPAPAVLGVNEPDRRDQANMPVERAVELWAKTVWAARDRPLGSPSVASDYGWLDRWWGQVQARGLRLPDFVAVHTYPDMRDPSKAARDLLGLVDWVHQRYGKPVWLTEFGACGGSDSAAEEFLKQTVHGLEIRPFLHRYAWFSDAPAGCYRPLFDGRGNLTRLGAVYRDAR